MFLEHPVYWHAHYIESTPCCLLHSYGWEMIPQGGFLLNVKQEFSTILLSSSQFKDLLKKIEKFRGYSFRTNAGTQLCLETKFFFNKSRPFKLLNKVTNISVVLLSSPIQIWGNSFKVFMSYNQNSEQTNRYYYFIYTCI